MRYWYGWHCCWCSELQWIYLHSLEGFLTDVSTFLENGRCFTFGRNAIPPVMLISSYDALPEMNSLLTDALQRGLVKFTHLHDNCRFFRGKGLGIIYGACVDTLGLVLGLRSCFRWGVAGCWAGTNERTQVIIRIAIFDGARTPEGIEEWRWVNESIDKAGYSCSVFLFLSRVHSWKLQLNYKNQRHRNQKTNWNPPNQPISSKLNKDKITQIFSEVILDWWYKNINVKIK